MNQIIKGLVAGTIFGMVSIIPMFLMQFEDKTRTIAASFIDRFAIGFHNLQPGTSCSDWLKGGIAGFVLRLPDVIVTGKYAPIPGLGLIGGIVCGAFAR